MIDEPLDVSALNNAVDGWFKETLQQVKNRYMMVIRGVGRSGDGFESLRSRTYQTAGETTRGSFGFDRYLIFPHKGAGKGMGGVKGSQWYSPSGVLTSTNPASLGKMNTGNRHAEEWLNPVLDSEVPKLADIVADLKASYVIKQIQIK